MPTQSQNSTSEPANVTDAPHNSQHDAYDVAVPGRGDQNEVSIETQRQVSQDSAGRGRDREMVN